MRGRRHLRALFSALAVAVAGCGGPAPGDREAPGPAAVAPAPAPAAVVQVLGAAAAAPAPGDPYAGPMDTWIAEWTVLIYAANDVRDRALAAAFDQDAEEWRRALGGSALFRVLVQRDYPPHQAGADGGPGPPSERYGLYRQQIYHPDDIPPATREACACGGLSLGETDTADPETLQAFLLDGIRRFPARHYWLVVTGHGEGWNGLAFDATTGPGRRLSVAGLRDALRAAAAVIDGDIRRRPGLGGQGTSDRIDVVQFDVCRMGAVEVAAELAGAADYLIASREVVPDAGHPYGALRSMAQDEPGMKPQDLVAAVVTDYVRSYVEGVSTQDRAYVGTSVASVGLDLRRMEGLVHALARVREAVRAERPLGFTCAEAAALGAQANAARGPGNGIGIGNGSGIGIGNGNGSGIGNGSGTGVGNGIGIGVGNGSGSGGRATLAEAAAADLVGLLEALADPRRPEGAAWPAVSRDVVEAAAAALAGIGRPRLAAAGAPDGVPLRYGGQYRELWGFNPTGPFVVEAHRVEPGSTARPGGLSVLWGSPLDLLVRDRGISGLDVYGGLRFEAATGWSRMFEACVEQARACLEWSPNPERPGEPSPCAGLIESVWAG